ncbi:cyclic-phosphate processing receiver domain-containing protein [Paenibacillus silviterrae]|uniref:cyclic-phosphate processing receiver domain-containing protein n=1 Tax=Paenibacillus silviterrae TaxID=3242194 RepID=UPI00350E3F57
MKLFLDDRRPCPRGFRVARSASDCIRLLRKHRIHVLSLDYNLGPGRPKGSEAARYIVQSRRFPKHIILHTADRQGRLSMLRLLRRNKPAGVRIGLKPYRP